MADKTLEAVVNEVDDGKFCSKKDVNEVANDVVDFEALLDDYEAETWSEEDNNNGGKMAMPKKVVQNCAAAFDVKDEIFQEDQEPHVSDVEKLLDTPQKPVW